MFREPPQHRPMLRDGERMLVDDAWRQYFMDLSRAVQSLRTGLEGVGVSPKWTSGDSYVVDDLVWSPANQLTYVCIEDVTGTTDPSEDTDDKWVLFGPSKIKRILRGASLILSGATTATFTIDPPLASLDKAELRYLGTSGDSTNAGIIYNPQVVLTSISLITATRFGSGAYGTYVSWELTEWW